MTADRERCVGSGMCALTASEVFDQDDEEGRVLVLAPVLSAGDEDAARDAADNCPAAAITVEP
ncbi:ferredoxin [Herbihabitans rhizosphaerae]|uniref:ferredoxin n=1 Tax=Herbihabitans rhizosphaerae TaxID=1872711 RepID=UPI0030FF2E6E